MLAKRVRRSSGGGLWDGYLYKEGDECTEYSGGWVAGYSSGTGSQSKESDHLYLTVSTTGAMRTYVTGDAIDLTDYNSVKIDWDRTGGGIAELIASTEKMDDATEYDAKFTKSGDGRATSTLDIGSLSGLYYIRAHIARLFSGTPVLKVYNIWLE